MISLVMSGEYSCWLSPAPLTVLMGHPEGHLGFRPGPYPGLWTNQSLKPALPGERMNVHLCQGFHRGCDPSWESSPLTQTQVEHQASATQGFGHTPSSRWEDPFEFLGLLLNPLHLAGQTFKVVCS